MQNKQAVIITTAGGGGMKSAARDIKDSMDYWGVSRTYVVKQSVWEYFWNDMPEKFKKSLMKKLDKTAVKILKNVKKPKPSLKVKYLYKMFKTLHLNDKMWKIDNEYWKIHKDLI